MANGRPAPDLILLAMKMTSVLDPDRVANVGDTTLDLESAARAGVRWNIGVLSGAHRREALRTGAPHQDYSVDCGFDFLIPAAGGSSTFALTRFGGLRKTRLYEARPLMISSTTKTSVRRARTWIDALMLSIICELIPGCPSTRRNAACVAAASALEDLQEIIERVGRAHAEGGGAVAVGLRQPRQRRFEALEMFAKLAGVRGALV